MPPQESEPQGKAWRPDTPDWESARALTLPAWALAGAAPPGWRGSGASLRCAPGGTRRPHEHQSWGSA